MLHPVAVEGRGSNSIVRPIGPFVNGYGLLLDRPESRHQNPFLQCCEALLIVGSTPGVPGTNESNYGILHQLLQPLGHC